MKKELDEKLTQEHPTLFGDRFAPMTQTCMCWGFGVGDGWYDLLKEAADQLEPLCRQAYERDAVLEKSWYKYVRNTVALTAKVSWLFQILYKIVNVILPNAYNNSLYWHGGPPRASQVKEKFGTLRFYMTHSTEEMEAIIDIAVRRSSVTCEECGKPGKLVGGGWIYCRCRECFDKLIERGYTLGDYDDQEENTDGVDEVEE